MFASALMDMSFYQTDVYIVDLQNKYLESALDEITELLRQQKAYCPKIRTIIERALAQSVDHCCGKQGWAVVNTGGSQEQYVVTEVVSARVTRMHTVTFDRSSAIKVVSCTCHEFTRMEVTCPGIVAVLKSQGEDPYDAKWLTEHWRLSYHPLWYKAMQRLAPLMSIIDLNGEASEDLQEPEAQQAIVSRYAKMSMIPVPTHANLRRAQMNDAFSSLRDDFDVPDSIEKYRQVMAAIFDLRSCFKGSPGQWVQDPLPPNGTITTQSWNGDQRAKPPINQANLSKRPAGKSQSDMSVREYRKKQKEGDFPTVAQRREAKGDWTLFLPTNGAAMFMCPLPGCMKKPIKNSDQSRYHHRCSQQHRRLLIEHPRPPAGIPGASTDACRQPSHAAAGIQGTNNEHVDEEVADEHVEEEVAADSYIHASDITDSVRAEVRNIAPTDPNLPLAANVLKQANALMDVLHRRQEVWTRIPPEDPFRLRGPAWSLVNVKPADRLPFMETDEMSHFRVNQFCEDCTEWRLCSAHEALASNDNVDFIAKHVEAMKSAGYVMVECGGEGDCFYHSMLFLASIYDQELYSEWHDHDTFRKKTCANLLVMLCFLMFLTTLTLYVSRFPTICL